MRLQSPDGSVSEWSQAVCCHMQFQAVPVVLYAAIEGKERKILGRWQNIQGINIKFVVIRIILSVFNP